MQLDSAKKESFSSRSSMHFKVMHIFEGLKSKLYHHISAIQVLYARYGSSRNRLKSSEFSKIFLDIGTSLVPTEDQIESIMKSIDKSSGDFIALNNMIMFCLKGMLQLETERSKFMERSKLNACLVELFVYLENFKV